MWLALAGAGKFNTNCVMDSNGPLVDCFPQSRGEECSKVWENEKREKSKNVSATLEQIAKWWQWYEGALSFNWRQLSAAVAMLSEWSLTEQCHVINGHSLATLSGSGGCASKVQFTATTTTKINTLVPRRGGPAKLNWTGQLWWCT